MARPLEAPEDLFWSVKVLVAQLCLTLCDPIDCSLSGSSVHQILQARILELVAIPFSRGSSCPGSPALKADFFFPSEDWRKGFVPGLSPWLADDHLLPASLHVIFPLPMFVFCLQISPDYMVTSHIGSVPTLMTSF